MLLYTIFLRCVYIYNLSRKYMKISLRHKLVVFRPVTLFTKMSTCYVNKGTQVYIASPFISALSRSQKATQKTLLSILRKF